jgi:beta-glucosidase
MSSYNKVNGLWSSENAGLLTEVLKKQWGFQGAVVSDWGAVHSTVATANAGCDLEMPTGKFMNRPAILKAIAEGQVAQALIDDKVRRILRVLFLSGRFDRRPGEKAGELNTPAHQQLARTAAAESTVLLKNQDGVLPLDPAKVHSVAVIGPNAAMGRVGGGGAALVNFPSAVSPLEGLKSRFGGQMQINYAPGLIQVGDLFPIETSWFTPPSAKPGEHGLLGEYFNNKQLSGPPVLTRIDPNVDFRWGAASPGPGVLADGFSVRWTGTLTVPKTADYYLDGFGDDGVRLILDGKTLFDSWGKPRITYTAEVHLEAGRPYALRYEYYENISAATARLGWREKTGDLTPAAVVAAAKSDVALVFVGLSDYFESETFDRKDLELPKGQAALIEAVAKANPNTVVVINAGSPVQVSAWLDKVRAVVMAWYPGQEDGNAIAAVLAGDADPGGRLPMSWPKQWKDSAAFGKYPGEKGAVPYSEGLFVGYRHFDRAGVEPQFPFGYGLSYTQFAYSNLRAEPGTASSSQRIRVSCEVQNTGTRPGSEVVQLYVRDVEASVPRPVKELKAFEKIRLKPGEKRQVSFDLGREALSFYDVSKHEWVAEPGAFEMLIGRSSRDIQLRGPFELAKQR